MPSRAADWFERVALLTPAGWGSWDSAVACFAVLHFVLWKSERINSDVTRSPKLAYEMMPRPREPGQQRDRGVGV